jgi:hypothetical protein
VIKPITETIDAEGFYAHRRSEVPSFPALKALMDGLDVAWVRVDKLFPRKATNARQNTLSANYGTGCFPPHTDFALRPVPPRYVVLFCPVTRIGETVLFCGERILKKIGRTGTFRMTFNGRSFSTFVNTPSSGRFFSV